MQNRFLILDGSPAKRVDFNVREIGHGLEAIGAQVILLQPNQLGAPIPERRFLDELHRIRPTHILWVGTVGLNYVRALVQYPAVKLMLWFDDPLMRIGHGNLKNEMRMAARMPNLVCFIWDGYWRARAKQLWDMDSRPIHLAVDPKEFSPASQIINRDEIVFIGHLHSPHQIAREIDRLPPVLNRLAMIVQDAIISAPESKPIPCWDALLLEGERQFRVADRQMLRLEIKNNPRALGILRGIVWGMAKNAARLRILRQALEVGPVRIFAEMEQLGHACAMEYHGLLGQWSDRVLAVSDTTGYSVPEIACCYQVGRIHINATDPQSVQGGIPYRVFQTAACGRPLLSDVRPAILECFQEGEEILTYADGAFGEALASAYADPERLAAVGRAARGRVERDHSWEIRCRELLKMPRIERNTSGPVVELSSLQFHVQNLSDAPKVPGIDGACKEAGARLRRVAEAYKEEPVP